MPVELNERLMREVAKCTLCGKGVGHTQTPVFYRITVEQVVVNMQAVQRQTGLAMMLGSASLAAIMGPDEAMGTVASTARLGMCLGCALEDLGFLIAAADEKEPEVANG